MLACMHAGSQIELAVPGTLQYVFAADGRLSGLQLIYDSRAMGVQLEAAGCGTWRTAPISIAATHAHATENHSHCSSHALTSTADPNNSSSGTARHHTSAHADTTMNSEHEHSNGHTVQPSLQDLILDLQSNRASCTIVPVHVDKSDASTHGTAGSHSRCIHQNLLRVYPLPQQPSSDVTHFVGVIERTAINQPSTSPPDTLDPAALTSLITSGIVAISAKSASTSAADEADVPAHKQMMGQHNQSLQTGRSNGDTLCTVQGSLQTDNHIMSSQAQQPCGLSFGAAAHADTTSTGETSQQQH